jgi:hypothetical protein
MATWDSVTSAKGYLLNVSTGSSFDTYVDSYHDLDIGNVRGRVVTGLTRAPPTTIGCALMMRPAQVATRSDVDYHGADHWADH